MIRYGFILAIICMIASASLAGVNARTKNKIIEQSKAEENASLKEVLAGAEVFKPVKSGSDIIYYKAYNKENKFIGAAFKASKKGYSSVVETIAGLTKDGTITAIKIINQNETPGLGSRVTEAGFTSRFSDKKIPDLNEVQAITGATISSRAVIESVREKAEQIKELIKNEN